MGSLVVCLYHTYRSINGPKHTCRLLPRIFQVSYILLADQGVIDLGLSLRTIQHETYIPSGQMVGLDGYGELIDWSQPSHNSNTQLKSEETGNQRLAQRYYNEEEESRGKLAYVKVNLDGLVVGRKVCLLDPRAYSTLALQLDDMFGMQTVSGLRLFQTESEFSLVYRDREGIWRNVGDVPWK